MCLGSRRGYLQIIIKSRISPAQPPLHPLPERSVPAAGVLASGALGPDRAGVRAGPARRARRRRQRPGVAAPPLRRRVRAPAGVGLWGALDRQGHAAGPGVPGPGRHGRGRAPVPRPSPRAGPRQARPRLLSKCLPLVPAQPLRGLASPSKSDAASFLILFYSSPSPNLSDRLCCGPCAS